MEFDKRDRFEKLLRESRSFEGECGDRIIRDRRSRATDAEGEAAKLPVNLSGAALGHPWPSRHSCSCTSRAK